MNELISIKKAFENLVDCYEQNILSNDLKVGYQHRKEMEIVFNNIAFKNNAMVLDIGCGVGTYTNPLTKKGCNVISIDFSKSMLKRTKERTEKQRISPLLVLASAGNLPFKNNYFDVVLCMEIFGHLPTSEIDKTVEEIKRVTKANGIIATSIPSKIWFGLRKLITMNESSLEYGVEFNYFTISELPRKFGLPYKVQGIKVLPARLGKMCPSLWYFINSKLEHIPQICSYYVLIMKNLL